MKIHRFYFQNLPKINTEGKEIEISNIEIIKQIKNVLRFKKGDIFSVFNENGIEAKILILEIDKKKIKGKVIEIENKEKKSKNNISLFLSILKRDNFEIAIQKAVECGVSEIIPIITERTIKKNLNYERLKRIIKESIEQSGQTKIPSFKKIIDFKEAFRKNLEEKKEIIFFDPKGEPLFNNFEFLKQKKDFCIFIGPEGGWSDREINLVKQSGIKVFSLSHFTLRSETAAIISCWFLANFY